MRYDYEEPALSYILDRLTFVDQIEASAMTKIFTLLRILKQ